MDFAWMAWTLPTAVFFLAIAGMLATLTVLELRRPTVPRRGRLPFATTRGDRVFLGLLTAAALHLLWLGVCDAPVFIASAGAAVVFALLLRYG